MGGVFRSKFTDLVPKSPLHRRRPPRFKLLLPGLGVRIPTSVIFFECAVFGKHGVGKLRIHVHDESPPGFRIIALQCARADDRGTNDTAMLSRRSAQAVGSRGEPDNICSFLRVIRFWPQRSFGNFHSTRLSASVTDWAMETWYLPRLHE